jgi:hypothetical protein
MSPEDFEKKFGYPPKCDPSQLAMLLRCSEKHDMSEWNQWREKNPNTKIWLQNIDTKEGGLKGAYLKRANLKGAHLEGTRLESAYLRRANLKGAHLRKANLIDARLKESHLEGSDLQETHLEGARLWRAHLEGAYLREANLESVDASRSFVDGKTLIEDCSIDDKTNFTMVDLDSARINPSLLVALKTNIRRKAWERYYEESPSSPQALFFRVFWNLSNYGSSTGRIFLAFFLSTVLFTILYLIIATSAPGVLTYQVLSSDTTAFIPWWLDITRNFCFAVATMVTLGFGGINVAIVLDYPCWSAFAFIVVTLNLLTGYFLLAVLVTRIGILFQSLGPEEQKMIKRDEPTTESVKRSSPTDKT